MEPALYFRFRFQWFEWAIAILCLFPIFFSTVRVQLEQKLKTKSETYSNAVIILFLAFGIAAKFSQYWFLAVDAKDFWLFVDYLFNFSHGNGFVTRFGPQGTGPIQHGAVHPYHWAVIPIGILSKWISPVFFAVIWNPLTLALSGFSLKSLLKTLKVQHYQIPLFLFAYLFSTHIAVIQEYDPHPETLYLLFTFMLVRQVLNRQLITASIIALLLGALKADAIFVAVPVIIAWAIYTKLNLKNTLIILFSSCIGYALGTAFVGLYKNGALGPSTILISNTPFSVLIPDGPFLGAKGNWSDWKSIQSISKYLIELNGGLIGTLKNYFHFLTSSSFLDLFKIAPWIALSSTLWISLLPIAFVFSLKGVQAIFWNYYSAPFLGIVWPIIVALPFTQRPRIVWILLLLSMVRGSASMNILFPLTTTRELISCAEQASKQIPKNSVGLVSGNLIRFTPFQQILSDQVLAWDDTQLRSSIQFVLSPLGLSKWGLSKEQQQQLRNTLSNQPEWKIAYQGNYCFLAIKNNH